MTNSVFESQVFMPLVRMISNGLVKKITLVSFEPHALSKNLLDRFNHPEIIFIVCKRLPLLGSWSLTLAAGQLMLAVDFTTIDAIRARGPLAGLIARRTRWWQGFFGVKKQLPLTIQARGLCAEEYRFSCQQQTLSLANKIVARWRQHLYKTVEKKAYGKGKGIIIEMVSTALGAYLQEHYKTPASTMVLAEHDLVEILDREVVAAYRNEIRSLLHIPEDAYVFCYSGSCKPWQCAEETIQFFIKQQKQNSRAFLLILSQDVTPFQKLLAKYQVPNEQSCLLAVKPKNLLRYLCAADAGILLRKPDIVNWVSRPTKLLEYQAIGLKIIHNNTIGLLL